MARQSTNSLFNSLRGRIWISTSVLAFFICTFGLISYLVVSLLVTDLFYGIFIPFLFLAFVVLVFGWWLSNEIVSPLERVTLLSKSLERSSPTGPPKSSGSFETDQLLETLFKNSQQMQTVVALMEKVASGKVDVSLNELDGSDRLGASFKKVLAKMAESVSAKEELDELRASLEQLKREISPIRSGNLAVELTTNDVRTKELTAAYRYLLDNLTSIITLIRSDSLAAQDTAKDVEQSLRRIIQQDESRINEMGQASTTLEQVPSLVQKISEDLGSSSQSARQSIEKAHQGSKIAHKNSTAVTQVKKLIREAIKRTQNLNERSLEIGKISNIVEDLANRTNMIALNASIQATELGEKGRGFVLVAEEIERLANRASGTTRQIGNLNKNISVEIKKVENSLDSTTSEISSLSKFAIETGNILSELERYVGQFLNLQENLVSVSVDKAEETDQAFLTFLNSITESEVTVDELRHSAKEIDHLSTLLRELQVAVGDFRIGYEESSSEERIPAEPAATEQAPETELPNLGGSMPLRSEESGKSESNDVAAVPVKAGSRPKSPEIERMTTEEEFDPDELNISEFYDDLNTSSGSVTDDELINSVT